MQSRQEYPKQPSAGTESYYQPSMPPRQEYPQQPSVGPQWSGPPPVQPNQWYPQQPPMYGPPPAQPYPWYPQQPPMGQPPSSQPPMQPAQQYPQQPPVFMQNYYQPSKQPMMTVNVNVGATGPSFVVRALWFICIGWWLGFWWLNVGYLLCVSILLLPVGLMMLNRLPQVLTLRAHSQHTQVTVSQNAVTVTVGAAEQQSMLMRAIYFVFVGWWLGGVWCYVGYSLDIDSYDAGPSPLSMIQ